MTRVHKMTDENVSFSRGRNLFFSIDLKKKEISLIIVVGWENLTEIILLLCWKYFPYLLLFNCERNVTHQRHYSQIYT